jgi:hypothetical protein
MSKKWKTIINFAKIRKGGVPLSTVIARLKLLIAGDEVKSKITSQRFRLLKFLRRNLDF